MLERYQINFRTDPEIDKIIDELKQDFYSNTGVSINTSQLIRKLIKQAYEKLQQNNR